MTRVSRLLLLCPALLAVVIGCGGESEPPAPVVTNPPPAPAKGKPSAKRAEMTQDLVP